MGEKKIILFATKKRGGFRGVRKNGASEVLSWLRGEKGCQERHRDGVLQSQLALIMLAYIHEAPAAYEALSWAV